MTTVSKLVYFQKPEYSDNVHMYTLFGDAESAPRNVRVYRLEVAVPDDAFEKLHEEVQDGIPVEPELVAEAVTDE